MTTPQNEFWQGSFGDEYLVRCRPDYTQRIPFWRDVLWRTKAKQILEIGCNSGPNLEAIRAVFAENGDPARPLGVEINRKARDEAVRKGFKVYDELGENVPILFLGQSFDLVFTAGVLIHLDDDELARTMEAIKAVSRNYVLAIEYAADETEAIEYRGHAERLWKRPFGKIYAEMGLKLVDQAGAPGFDRCTYWLLRKP